MEKENKDIYVCELVGENVWGKASIICTIDTLDKAQKVVDYCEKEYELSFEKKDSCPGFRSYRCTDYSKDVCICIMSVSSLEEKVELYNKIYGC